MRTTRFAVLLFAITLTQSTFAAEAATPQYGDKGTFDLSLGMSTVRSTHAENLQLYSIFLAPYANHFLFKNWFARYELPVFYEIRDYLQTEHIFSISPGLALGYGFRISELWRLNVSAGYARTLWWDRYASGGSGPSRGSITFVPELKYLITPNWAAGLLLRGSINLYESDHLRISNVSTTTYIVLSYIF